MKLIVCTVFLFSLSVSMPGLAQENPASVDLPTDSVISEQDQIVLPVFELAENPNIEQRIYNLLNNNVTVFNRTPEKINLAELRLLRFAVRRQISGILATEGYFSPVIKFETKFDTKVDTKVEIQTPNQEMVIRVIVDLGPPTQVGDVQISFVNSAVPAQLQQTIQSSWSLQKGELFRDDSWTQAKAQAMETLIDHGYAAAKISFSEAVVHDQQADLIVALDSGPIFHIGELNIQGLNSYGLWLLDSYHPPVKGDVYSQANLIKFQRGLQNSPYFSTVTVSIDPNPELASAVPVNVVIQERKKYDIGLAAGYSTNTGARGEISYQDRDFISDAYNLKSVVRIEQLRQIGYADIFLPPKPSGYLDSVGVLFERADIEGLVTQTSSFGAKRVITEDSVEKRLGLSFVYEKSTVNDAPNMYAKALFASIGRTWRNVDNAFNPRDGKILQVDLGGAAKVLLSDQNFVSLYGKYQQWIPVGKRDVVILRVEGGYVIAPDDIGIPEDYLFRAGGTGSVGSVRGYAYQSLGVAEANGVVGGRVLTTASAEYVHWLNNTWGVAGFVDLGDAADRFSDLRINQGIGLGLRYKTPAGPIAVDLAYGRQAHQVRVDFFLGIAF
jgi:translocation and assembly module TamA